MPRRRRPGERATGSGSGSGSSSSGRPFPGPSETVAIAMAPSSSEVASAGSGSTGETMQKMAAAASSGGVPTVAAADMGLSGGVLQKQSSKVEVDGGLSEETMLHKHRAKESDTAKDTEYSDPNNKILHTNDESIQEAEILMIQKLNDLGKGEDISGKEFLAYYKKLSPGPCWIDLDVSLEDEELDEQENRHALYRLRYYKHKFIKQASKEELIGDKLEEDHHLSLLHKSEDDDCKEFLEDEGDRYGNKLEEDHHLSPLHKPEKDDCKEILEDEDDPYGDKLKEGHHLSPLHKSKDDCKELLEDEDDPFGDKLKEDHHLSLLHKPEKDCDAEFLEKEGFFRRFEEDSTFDWFFHPDYLDCASLNDYQCLVLKNYCGTEYTRWSEYHKYLHSYEIELEYVKYCEELSKQLKWMEDYVDTDRPSVKWSKISSRGAYQAIKIAATSFHKITPTLAYNGYFEFKESMVYDYTFYKEVHGVYFEIWQRITHGTKSFKEALEEVYNLNRFLSRQCLMKAALESDDTMKKMEEEFRTCTKAIKPGVEDKAEELISEAVKKLVDEPKSYEQYIRKKIHIARIIGILDSDDEE